MSFLALSGRESSLLQTFCESSEQLDISHPSDHMHDSEICDSRLFYFNVTVILGGLLQHKKSFHHETQCDGPLLGVA